jgi:hypothetical protein
VQNRKRIRSIRSKDDPAKPCNNAFAEGERARREGRSENDCPYADGTSYGAYLREWWLKGFRGWEK